MLKTLTWSHGEWVLCNMPNSQADFSRTWEGRCAQPCSDWGTPCGSGEALQTGHQEKEDQSGRCLSALWNQQRHAGPTGVLTVPAGRKEDGGP